MLQRLILVTVLIAFIAPAQVPYGRMTGRVIDSAGAVVPAAAVRVKNLDTNLVTSASSDSQGNYEVRNLIPGSYRLSVEQQGFKRYERGPMEVRVGDVLTVDVGLELGAVSDSVTVTSEAPLLESGTATLGQLIDGRRLLELPMPYSNALYLNQLTPGVIATTPPTGNWQVNQPGNASGISVNGTTTASNEYVLDGTPSMRESGFVACRSAGRAGSCDVRGAEYDAGEHGLRTGEQHSGFGAADCDGGGPAGLVGVASYCSPAPCCADAVGMRSQWSTMIAWSPRSARRVSRLQAFC
jgi:hypothetical protein